MCIYHPMMQNLNLFFYKLNYLVKNLFTFRPEDDILNHKSYLTSLLTY